MSPTFPSLTSIWRTRQSFELEKNHLVCLGEKPFSYFLFFPRGGHLTLSLSVESWMSRRLFTSTSRLDSRYGQATRRIFLYKYCVRFKCVGASGGRDWVEVTLLFISRLIHAFLILLCWLRDIYQNGFQQLWRNYTPLFGNSVFISYQVPPTFCWR